MDILADFHPGIQYAIYRLISPDLTFEKLGLERDIAKQAVEKSYKKAIEYLKAYALGDEKKQEPLPCAECAKKNTLIANLRRQLILYGITVQSLRFFKEQVLKFFPKFKVKRLPAFEKKSS